MEDYQEKFLDAEKTAGELVADLAKLKQEIVSYNAADKALVETQKELNSFASKLSDFINELNSFIAGLKEIGIEKVVEVIEDSETGAKERHNILLGSISRVQLMIGGVLIAVLILGILVLRI